MTDPKKVLEFGVRTLHIGGQEAKWCISCNGFMGEPPDHLPYCPYGALATTLAELEDDARRYRFLRGDGSDQTAYWPEEQGIWGGIELDEAIDKKMAGTWSDDEPE